MFKYMTEQPVLTVTKRDRISYINVDSSQRNLYPINAYEPNFRKLPNQPLLFTDGSNKITITDPNHTFRSGDLISINNVVNPPVVLDNVISIKSASRYVRIRHPNHGFSLSGLYDSENPELFRRVNYVDSNIAGLERTEIAPDTVKYYILREQSRALFVNIRGVRGEGVSGDFIGNIPVNTINGTKQIVLIFRNKNGVFELETDSYLIELEETSNINYTDVRRENVFINSLMIYGIPLNMINSGTPISAQQRIPFLTIFQTTDDSYTVEVSFPAIVPQTLSSAGGNNIIVRRVISSTPGYPNPSSYVIPLTRTFRNIIQSRVIASSFPNSQRTINKSNNRIYWRDLDSGPNIYYIEVPSGNYSADCLTRVMESLFSRVPLFRYAPNSEFITAMDMNEQYDGDNYKFHIINVNINTETDIVSFSSFREIILRDRLNEPLIINIPNNRVIFTQAGDLMSATILRNIYNLSVSPFLEDETMFVLVTPDSHKFIDRRFPYTYGNMYRYLSRIGINNYFSYTTIREDRKAFLMNFMLNETQRELNSINTSTKLINFTYNPLTRIINLPDHRLSIGDVIITDQFDSINNNVRIYEIDSIIDEDNFRVFQYSIERGMKIIYGNLLINFYETVLSIDVTPVIIKNKTLSFVDIIPLPTADDMMIINHRNHNLIVGDRIQISGSVSVNRTPNDVINTEHIIFRVIDNNSYAVRLSPYTPLSEVVIQYNTVSLVYPVQLQLLFNFKNTMGNYLGFRQVGEETSITEFAHIITNQSPYEIPNDYTALGDEYIPPIKKLSFTGPDYCYIQCPQLGINTYQNTRPVQNVITKIRWWDIPGTVVFDSFEPAISLYDDPIRNISFLQINIVNRDGTLVEFNGLNHSFTIEITEAYKQLN